MKINRRSALAGIALQVRAQSSLPVERPRAEVMSAFWEPLDRQMIDWLAPAKSAHVLDAGCGRGDHVRLFAERCQVTGVDLKSDLLAYARGRLATTRPSALGRNDPDVLTKTDPPERMTMDRHARSPEKALPDLPPVVPAG